MRCTRNTADKNGTGLKILTIFWLLFHCHKTRSFMKYTQIYLLIIRGGGGGKRGSYFPGNISREGGDFLVHRLFRLDALSLENAPRYAGWALFKTSSRDFLTRLSKSLIYIYILKLDGASIVRLGFEAGNTSYI